MKEKTHLVRNRCLFSIVIIVIYFICHRIPLNGIDMNDIILSKDKDASIKYNHRINLEQFVMERRTKDND